MLPLVAPLVLFKLSYAFIAKTYVLGKHIKHKIYMYLDHIEYWYVINLIFINFMLKFLDPSTCVNFYRTPIISIISKQNIFSS